MTYDEPAVLTDYVWSQCQDHMTELERMGLKAVIAREKSRAAGGEALRRMILAKWGGLDDPAVVAALVNGVEAFRLAIRDRVLRDHPEVVNRCPQCSRVARTPRARQCRWCLHDWHSVK